MEYILRYVSQHYGVRINKCYKAGVRKLVVLGRNSRQNPGGGEGVIFSYGAFY